jgi:hypothetical protein
MVSHVWLRVAVQLQPAAAVTLVVLDPAAAEGFTDVGATVNVHGADAPA